MNALFRLADFQPHPLSVHDVRLMVEAGILAENAKVELIDGVLLDMPSEGGEHISWKARLTRWFNRQLSDAWEVIPDATLYLGERQAPEPDIYLYPSRIRFHALTGADVVLAVEICHTSDSRDLKRKPDLYAAHGVQEYWVLNIGAGELVVFRQPTPQGYASLSRQPWTDRATVAAHPEIWVEPASLGSLL